MIRTDYKDGGFPLCRRAPIICALSDGVVRIVYNRFDLKKVMQEGDVQSCTGIWPGKKTTDCFVLDLEAYGEFSPPEKYKEIDSAMQVTVFSEGGKFDRIEYIPGPHEKDQRLHMTRNKEVYQYLLDAGLRFKRSFS